MLLKLFTKDKTAKLCEKRHCTQYLSFVLVLLMVLLAGCNPVDSNNVIPSSQPVEVAIDIPAEPWVSFDEKSRSILFRYLAGSFRWEIRERHGLKYAIRREKVDGEYLTTLNGYYSVYNSDSSTQTRVAIVFEKPWGLNRYHSVVTQAKAGTEDLGVIVEVGNSGRPRNTSYLIIEGDLIYLEIFDQAPKAARQFTQDTLVDVFAELTDVLKYRDEIETTGMLPAESRFSSQYPNTASFDVSEEQRGIYLLNADVSLDAPGYIYAKVFNVKTGKRLSKKRLTPRSTRYVGWSNADQKYFPYNAQVSVYEGNSDSEYEARFELWHKPEGGEETKVAETIRFINGWQR